MGFGQFFGNLGRKSAENQFISIFFCFTVTCIFGLGLLNMRLETDPQNLWVSHDGRTYKQQDYFNQNFGAFFRTNQLIISHKNPNVTTNLFDLPYLLEMYYLVKTIRTRSIESSGKNITIDNFCFKPISGKGCLTPNPADYWKMNITDLLLNHKETNSTRALQYTALCVQSRDEKSLIPCSDSNGVPVMRQVVLGGISCEKVENDQIPCDHCWVQSKALIGTLLLNNDPFTLTDVLIWEKQIFMDTIDRYNSGSLNFSDYLDETIYDMDARKDIKVNYLSQRSIPDELVTETSQNAWVVVLSYLLMFLYISMAIGSFPSKVHSGFLLGISGIFIVISSIICSLGIMSFAGVGVTMISAQVIPFLILAIGVDNMFIISNAVQVAKGDTLELKIFEGLSQVGPSITTAAFCESLAFGVGILTQIPALQTFCLQAGVAVLFDYVFQLTTFVAILAWDEQRKMENRCDVVCCIRAKEVTQPRPNIVNGIMEKKYIPLLFKKPCQIVVIIMAIVFFTLSVIGCFKLQPGLEPQVSLVTGSKLNSYFDSYNEYLEVGPPAYLVLKNFDYLNETNLAIINEISNGLSLLNATVQPPVYSWIASFSQFKIGEEWKEDCGTDGIERLSFANQVRLFMDIKINSPCCQRFGFCGEQFDKDIIFNDDGTIKTSRLRFQHRTVKTSKQYIDTFQQTRQTIDTIIQSHHNDGSLNSEQTAYSYSLIYVFYDQYSYIRAVAIENLLLALGAVYACIVIIQNVKTALLVTFCVLMITFDMIGLVWVTNEMFSGFVIEVNAISVVNLITSVGLAVEFCVHISIAYMHARGTRQQQTEKALVTMGSNVVVGIACTKLLGVIVLGFASSELFRLYYFRMYMCIIVLGVFVGLMFLPVMLSLIGPLNEIDLALFSKVQDDLVESSNDHNDGYGAMNDSAPSTQ